MTTRFKIRPLNRLEQVGDILMYPAMRILMELNGTPDESPQETHRWNNHKFSTEDARRLDLSLMVRVDGDVTLKKRRWLQFIPVFHLSIWGWQRYTVLRPRVDCGPWYVGWLSPDVSGYSRLPIKGAVRSLRGPDDAYFFALDASGRQISIMEIGRGKLGDPTFPYLPLR